MTTSSLGTAYFLLFFFLAVVASVSSEDCSYTILVKTGTVKDAGTDATISVTLKDSHGSQVKIPNLEDYGIMGSGHDYFENGNLDTFIITTTCTKSPVCSLTLSSDNSRNKPGWYIDYVRVQSIKRSSRAAGDDITFDIYGWIATDEAPWSLTRTINRCPPTLQEQIINAIIE